MSFEYRTLGIMALFKGEEPSFKERGYYKMLTLAGRKLRIRVFVFSPRSLDFENREVSGYEFEQNRWIKKTFPFPKLVYDRCFIGSSIRTRYKPLIDKLQEDPEVTFLGHGLTGKWQVYQTLLQSEELAQYLPETQQYSFKHVTSLLMSGQDVIVKPASGTHGLSVIRLSRHSKQDYEVLGRNHSNQVIHKRFTSLPSFQRFLTSFTASRPFILQPYLTLHTPSGTPFDIRVLVQKNGNGEWETTGKAVRLGEKNGITSNLHGGGKAVAIDTFLSQNFAAKNPDLIEQEIDHVIRLLPPFLESNHGRLVELGIDIGIDQSGKIWIIEVNSRPGRTVFRQIEDRTAQLRSLTQPVKYAVYLMNERVGGY
ncbi:YheC/YheD family protein [Brevibacillus ginsengisoli]|uniref:YheC/YheD family endospore coat-associated protein n=1 Tax=Brevibacillus ginsengisoli TaxID=363854 RepID=UPI003CED8CEA